jgi:hypothetical protein
MLHRGGAVMSDTCPFLEPPVSLGPDRSEFAIYCRFPDGRVHVPDRVTMKTVCAVGRFRDCPHYQRHAIAG